MGNQQTTQETEMKGMSNKNIMILGISYLAWDGWKSKVIWLLFFDLSFMSYLHFGLH